MPSRIDEQLSIMVLFGKIKLLLDTLQIAPPLPFIMSQSEMFN